MIMQEKFESEGRCCVLDVQCINMDASFTFAKLDLYIFAYSNGCALLLKAQP